MVAGSGYTITRQRQYSEERSRGIESNMNNERNDQWEALAIPKGRDGMHRL